ncbi:MAG: TRAP transporter small permease [Spirochaetes bacterium]|nr:TRAP transporter small permease [Spirochaetota bacterium]
MSIQKREFDRYLSTSILGALILLVALQVVMRVIFLSPLIGAEELARYFLICVVFLGAPFAARTGGHIRMEELLQRFPLKLRTGISFLICLSAVLVFGIVSVGSVITLLRNLQNRTATLSIPFPIFIAPTVLGFVLLTFEYTRTLFDTYIRKR